MKKEIQNQLKSDYEKLEIKPSADLWNKIDQMDFSSENMSDFSSVKTFGWWKYAAVIALLISFGAFFYFSLNRSEKNTVIAKNNKSEKTLDQKDLNVEIINSNLNQVENRTFVFNENKTQDVLPKKKVEHIQQNNLSVLNNQISLQEEPKTIVDFPSKNLVISRTIDETEKPVIAEKKKINYIKADELLLGREFDKTRKEHLEEDGKFGVLDMSKIKIKGPGLSSFKVLGMTVFSDSLDSK